jgi:hypothetical protein
LKWMGNLSIGPPEAVVKTMTTGEICNSKVSDGKFVVSGSMSYVRIFRFAWSES